jgi:hypothetical protein
MAVPEEAPDHSGCFTARHVMYVAGDLVCCGFLWAQNTSGFGAAPQPLDAPKAQKA